MITPFKHAHDKYNIGHILIKFMRVFIRRYNGRNFLDGAILRICSCKSSVWYVTICTV